MLAAPCSSTDLTFQSLSKVTWNLEVRFRPALIGALVVGDSVRGSLREMALARLGKTHLALASNERLFRSQLAPDLEAVINHPVVPALQLPVHFEVAYPMGHITSSPGTGGRATP